MEDSFLELRFRSNIRLAGQEKVLLACLATELRLTVGIPFFSITAS